MSLGPLLPLATYAQFIVVLRDGKLPLDYRTGNAASAHDPAVWMTYEAASDWVDQHGPQAFGVGYVITRATGFFCLDIDGALQPDGTWSALSREMVALLPGCVTEVSQSGRGLHLWGWRERMPPHSSKNIDLHVELYSDARYILLGHNRVGQMTGDCLAIDNVISVVFPPRETGGLEHGAGPCPGWRGPTDDNDLLRRALQSRSARSAFGRGASFQALWDADEAILAQAYPTTGEGPYDASSADAALAQHLAFWTGKDSERIGRLMRMSKLARGKWEREDYFNGTIFNACSWQKDILSDPLPEPVAGITDAVGYPPVGGVVASAYRPAIACEITGSTFLGSADQVELFKGCVYIIDAHKVLLPGGRMVNPERFKAIFGGRTFTMDTKNERTTRNAFEAFTESQAIAHPRADGTCFRPTLEPAAIITDNGRTRANLWWPVVGARKAGDPAPFLRHMRKLVPNERDLRALLSVSARWVQSPGHKSAFGIVLQGVEGNGKSYFSRALSNCFGSRYVHWPKAAKVAAQFNSWLVNKLLICVEDIYVSGDVDVLEDLKPMIAGGSELEIEAKGVDQISSEICCNFILNTNHKTGIKKTKNDRRLMVIWCAQQSVEDLLRDGMDGEYMAALYNWSDNGGWAIIHDYLATYPIDPEFDPMGRCQRAPAMSMTNDVIASGLGRVEQEIQEAIETETPGFCGGWISSILLGRLLTAQKLDTRMSLARRREMLEAMGYVTHPGLAKGRTDNVTLPDAGKPVLWVRSDRADLLSIRGGANVARAYREAQSPK